MSAPTLPDLKVVWPTRSRTGSQFVLQLTMAVAGGLQPQSRINGGRREGHKPNEKTGQFLEMFKAGKGFDYLTQNNIRSLKFEDPGKDDFVEDLAEAAPNARFVASYRPIERVIESHYNIEKWGHLESDVLYQFSACLTLYERLASHGRLFLINVDDKSGFDLEAFAAFLGIDTPPERAKALVAEWAPLNTLQYQVEKSGADYRGRRRPPRIDRLNEIHDWVPEYEQRYRLLCKKNDLG